MVAAVAHTYERTATEIGDGRLASVFGSHLGGPRKGDDRSLSTAAYVRVLGLKSVATAFLLRSWIGYPGSAGEVICARNNPKQFVLRSITDLS
jgi:hypothetical protein